jgi:hypothetical protein
LAALPPPTAKDVMWIGDWTAAANQVAKSILYFGITQPADPLADAPAVKHNMSNVEDQRMAHCRTSLSVEPLGLLALQKPVCVWAAIDFSAGLC